jgi:hypothetical protein
LTASVKEAKAQIESELKSFSVIVEAAKTPFGKVKKTYSGKSGGARHPLSLSLSLCLP